VRFSGRNERSEKEGSDHSDIVASTAEGVAQHDASWAVVQSGIWLLNQPKKTSASANRSGDTNLRMAVALVNGTRSIVVPCRATIWPEWP